MQFEVVSVVYTSFIVFVLKLFQVKIHYRMKVLTVYESTLIRGAFDDSMLIRNEVMLLVFIHITLFWPESCSNRMNKLKSELGYSRRGKAR